MALSRAPCGGKRAMPLPSSHRKLLEAQEQEQFVFKCRGSGFSPISSLQGKSTQMALDFNLPGQIYDEKELYAFLNMDSWNGYLSPDEKQSLLCFLPKGEQSDDFVESLLNGHILRFGIDPAKKWGNRVCNDELHQEVLLRSEEKLKALQSQFYRDLIAFNRRSISEAQEMKRLFLDVFQSDERKFWKQLRKMRKRERKNLRNRRTETQSGEDLTAFGAS